MWWLSQQSDPIACCLVIFAVVPFQCVKIRRVFTMVYTAVHTFHIFRKSTVFFKLYSTTNQGNTFGQHKKVQELSKTWISGASEWSKKTGQSKTCKQTDIRLCKLDCIKQADTFFFDCSIWTSKHVSERRIYW